MTIRNWRNPGTGRWDEDLLVTVEIASTWLERVSPRQAKVRQALVDRYAEMRRAGLWDEDNESPIKLDVRGEVIDGKHRLWMVVETGLATKFHIHYNVPSPVYNVTDTGRLRGLDDVAFPRFHGDRQASAVSKAMATLGLTDDRGRPQVQGIGANLPLMRIFQEQHQDAIAFTCRLFKTKKRGLSAPVKAAVACAYYYVPRHELMLFVDRLYRGVITDESESAVIRLRDWLTGSSFLLGGGGGAQEKYLKTARAIQLFHQRKQVSQLFAVSRNPFPPRYWVAGTV